MKELTLRPAKEPRNRLLPEKLLPSYVKHFNPTMEKSEKEQPMERVIVT